MIHGNRSDDCGLWFLDDVGGIQTAAKACFEKQYVCRGPGEGQIGRRRSDLEEGDWLTSRRSAKDDGRTESDGRTVSDEFLASGFVREVVVTGHVGPVYLEAGKRMGEVLGGLVYGNYGLGAVASLDFRELDLGPWSFSLAADMVGEDWSDYTDPNPLLSMRVEWEYDFFESLVFLCIFRGSDRGEARAHDKAVRG